ncbi:hypothetical protein M9H77_16701 [Catharanthus roseus]|uniref:Uncharacterized protein n=1 Tax=Catharanthus roseus TaxID=4058 RepID=A0ACC0B2W6_CATRO|nr:hypothetical protein M9H77_16701 [Catharanthus roseus]
MEYNWSNPSWKKMDFPTKFARDKHNFYNGGGHGSNACDGNNYGIGNFTPKRQLELLLQNGKLHIYRELREKLSHIFSKKFKPKNLSPKFKPHKGIFQPSHIFSQRIYIAYTFT